MPPKNSNANAARRKGPQFNPPRPVQAPKKGSTATKRAPVGPAKNAAIASAARPEIISSDDEEEEEHDNDDDDDDIMEDAPPAARNTRPPPASATPDPVPVPLLTRLLHENFEDSNTQIQKGAMDLVAKYTEIFVREAFARAKHERELSVKAGAISDGFLQVEDLEKLAPQLVLDF